MNEVQFEYITLFRYLNSFLHKLSVQF